MGKGPRLLMIGIDGADHGMVQEWLAARLLPNLQRLLSAGHLFAHHSTHPPLTAPAWTTIFTGCDPGKHGLYDFMDYSYPERRPWWEVARSCPSLWSLLTEAGLRVAAVNMPMAYPAEAVEGAFICGFGAPSLSDKVFHPAGLGEALRGAVPGYDLHPTLEPGNWPSVTELNRYTDMRARALWHILGSQCPDVVCVVLNALDWAGHAYAVQGSGPDGPMARVAAHIDTRLGDLLAVVDWPRTPVMVVSDHGMRCARRTINLPNLFTRLGLMRLSGQPAGRASGGSLSRRALLRAWYLLKRALPAGALSRLRRGAEGRRQELLAATETRIDWEHTVAAPLVGLYGCIRLNVRGRDPQGIVKPDEYQTVARETADLLRSVTDGTGQPVFSDVLVRDEIYHGDRVEEAPDLVLWPRARDMTFGAAPTEQELALYTAQAGIISPLHPPTGVHGRTGILLVSGDDFGRLDCGDTCDLADVTPTALGVLGLPVPSHMDGRPLLPADTPSAETGGGRGPGECPAEDVYSQEEAAQLTERLKALGYM